MSKTITKHEALSILNVPEDADHEQIKSAFREQAKRCHPDTGGSPYLFRLVRAAFETLLNAEALGEKGECGQKKQLSWLEVITHKDFCVPFEDFKEIILQNKRKKINWRTCSVGLSSSDFLAHHIRTSFHITIRIRSWKSRLHYLFRLPVANETNRITYCENGGRNSDVIGASMQFYHRIAIGLPEGFHVVEMELLDRCFCYKFSLGPLSPSEEKEECFQVSGCRNLHVVVQACFNYVP